MHEIINKILEISRQGRSCVVATVVASSGSSPRKIGARMLVCEDAATFGTVGGGGLEKLAISDALVALKKKTSFFKSYSLKKGDGLQVCGGEVSIYYDVVSPRRHLVIAGGGHIGLSLSLIAKLLGYEVTLVDNRKEYASRSRFPHADHVICGRYETALPKAAVDQTTAIVIVTHGHLHDAVALRFALKSRAAYIGMIGSRAKIAHVFGQMRRLGFSPARLKRVHTPIGLDIGAESPEEIAVAIAAELIQEYRQA
jgi:xanthine dehydrogenase accessory factor